jgi:hypothetical protein
VEAAAQQAAVAHLSPEFAVRYGLVNAATASNINVLLLDERKRLAMHAAQQQCFLSCP